MSRLPVILLLSLPALALAEAQEDAPAGQEGGGRNRGALMSLLRDGSRLKDVMMPRYSEDRHLEALLKGGVMTWVNEGVVSGTDVLLELYNPDTTRRGRIDLAEATYFRSQGLLKSTSTVVLRSERVTAKGAGIYYLLESGKGYMPGPATVLITRPPTETAMNASSSPIRATAAGLALIGQSLLAAPPPEAAPATSDEAHKARMAETRTAIRADLAQSRESTAAADKFIKEIGAEPPPAELIPEPDKPLEITPDPTKMTMDCDGGVYFDPKENVVVCRQNVVVKDPRFDLSGLNELKIYFEKKPEAPKEPNSTPPSDKKPDDFAGLSASFGKIEKVVGTGAVKLDQKPQDGSEPIHASGAVFTYNVKTGQATLAGGYPWVIQGPKRFRAQEKNAIIRIHMNESTFDAEGKFGAMLPTDSLKKKNP